MCLQHLRPLFPLLILYCHQLLPLLPLYLLLYLLFVKVTVRQLSVLLRDFHCGQISTTPSTATSSQSFSTKLGTQYPLGKYISYDSLSFTHKHFVNTISSVLEPTSYAQAVLDLKWKETMQRELDALNSQKMWSSVPLLVGHHPIGSKWVYRIKYNSNGTIECYKKTWITLRRLLLWLN